MLADKDRPTPTETYSGEALVASLDDDLKLPETVTKETLKALRAEHTMPLDNVIALLTGLPHDQNPPGSAERRWHAAVWLFKQAAKAPHAVASGTRDHKEFIPIEPHDFQIPSCLGSKDNSIRTDIGRADDDTFNAWWRGPLTRWHDVRFNTSWLDATVRALKPRSTKKPPPASEAATRRAFEERVAVWTGEGKPSEEDDFNVLSIILGQPVHRTFRNIRHELAPPHWVKRGRPAKSKSAKK